MSPPQTDPAVDHGQEVSMVEPKPTPDHQQATSGHRGKLHVLIRFHSDLLQLGMGLLKLAL